MLDVIDFEELRQEELGVMDFDGVQQGEQGTTIPKFNPVNLRLSSPSLSNERIDGDGYNRPLGGMRDASHGAMIGDHTDHGFETITFDEDGTQYLSFIYQHLSEF